ncbi:hypothetical protein BaRGS_00016095 [Batillaria attramentaria]|uniref:Uncharacterized protein n=2 Tax=Batillaria attramentaria TaxID=370345 RepID=A0ABD0KZS1_9CAEN
MTEKVGKRARIGNFSAEQVRILLEELQVEHMTVFSSHSATITQHPRIVHAPWPLGHTVDEDEMTGTCSCSVGVAKVKKVALSSFQTMVFNLYNVRTKIRCATAPFKSERELPLHTVVDTATMEKCLHERLEQVFEEGDEHRQIFCNLGKSLLNETSAKAMVKTLSALYSLCWDVISQWGAQDKVFIGVIPKPCCSGSDLTIDVDQQANKLFVHWPREELGHDFLQAAQRMLRRIRQEARQPTEAEYFVTHLAYLHISNGGAGTRSESRPLGTPGFRPHTQTYMSLTDPGEGHVLGTTRFCDWLKGAIVHVEHLERPRHLPRENIESYRIPSIIDFARVRLHVGPSAPTTYFVGRAVRDSGNFNEDFLKVVNLTAAAASAAFFLGAAECKVSMERLSTNQALRYMRALRAQVPRSKNQFLSAAWNLNQILQDDFDHKETTELTERMDIAMRAIEITSFGGFDKVTWDGASDTYPSKCIMYQLSHKEALTIVHEAHLKGLVTYFSAGFKFNEIRHAVYAGVDGIGIGGAQVLRYMDSETGMHGPYMEENIPRILANRDEAAESVRGRGVHLLARVDTMYFEGSLSRDEDVLRQKLFRALLESDETEVSDLLLRLARITTLPSEGDLPHLHRARRLVEAENPMLKEFCTQEEWDGLTRVLRALIVARDEANIMEEYDSDPWLSVREKYRFSQCPRDSRICYVRQASFTMPLKA